uniref:Uncharacterized protein n=1 Tax=Caenorhabditis japonica TaxID=281687 RepID=A0A8R1DFX9_CAEJA
MHPLPDAPTLKFEQPPVTQKSMSFDSISAGATGCFPRRAHTINATDDAHTHTVTVYMHSFNPECENDKIRLEIHKRCTTEELIEKVLAGRAELEGQSVQNFDLFEMMGTPDGQTYKERRLDPGEYPVAVQAIWSRLPVVVDAATPKNRFVFRHRGYRAATGGTRFGSAEVASSIDAFLTKFLAQPHDREYADLCMLPELTEQTLLDNLRERFANGHIYTYIGPILVAVNPFCMLRIKENQCVVISGESGSGKTESTNHLMSHLISLSQKGSTGCSTEQTLLSAGPVLEAFGNAVTLTNNNSSRFGKFIKINYRENGMVSGNYHVFYYLLEGADEEERNKYFLLKPNDYNYLNQNEPFVLEGVNEKNEFDRLRHAMSSVGFCAKTQQTIFGIISAVLLLGNITYIKRHGYHSDESGYIENEEVVDLVANLLQIKTDTLTQALTMKRHVMKAETVVLRYSVSEATNTRDAMAKCIYNSLFHYIVLRINQALLKKDFTAGRGYYIGILDIFGFEDVGAQCNSFEQLCINYANEKLQSYFNQHIFQFEQEEYLKEGISWTNIEYTDNTECVQLFQSKPYGILRLVDEESNINNGTDDSMLAKLNQFLKNNEYYETPQKKEPAFIVAHYAGKVKYQITGFREKNKDLMRLDVLNALKSSTSSVMKTLLGIDPVAVHRWNVVRSVFRAMNAFKQSARKLQKSESAGHLRVQDSIVTSPRRGSDSALSAFLRGELRCEVPDFCDTSMFNTIRNQARRTPAAKSDDKMSLLKSLQILKEAIGGRRLTKKPSSVSKQFEYSLTRLMNTLADATPYFIRCIKSNNDKIANHFDDNIILRQLRYTGMLETVRIRRAGYSVRIEYPSFVQQYRILLRNSRESTVEDVKEFIHSHPSIDNENIQYGTHKIFMRDAEKLILDDHLHRTIMQSIDTLQRWFRTLLARKRYLRMKEGIVKIQALIRGSLARSEVRKKALAAQKIQCNWKKHKERRKYLAVRSSILALQSAWRGAETRKRIGEIPKAAGNGTKKSPFRVRKVHAVNLTKFDLSDPNSLAAFAISDDESDSDKSTQDGLDDDISEESDAFQDDDAVDVDATFILEDTKLKLIEGADLSHHRRQSLAPTASTTKLKMLRRANSTESNNFSMSRCDDTFTLNPANSKKKTAGAGKLGFQKAKKNLKALFGGRKEDEEEPSPGPSFTAELTPDVFISKDHQFKMSRLHRQEICALCNRHLTNFISQAHKCQSGMQNVSSQGMLRVRLFHSMQSDVASSIANTTTLAEKAVGFDTDPGNMVVESTEDLRQFSVFIFNKTTNLSENTTKRDTVVDAVFKKSLRAFHMELLGYEAVLSMEQSVLKYRDVITMFEGLLTKVCKEEGVSFPTTLGVNAFSILRIFTEFFTGLAIFFEISQKVKYLGRTFADDGSLTEEVARRIRAGWAAFNAIRRELLQSPQKTRIRLLTTTVIPAMTYGCETWTSKEADTKRLQRAVSNIFEIAGCDPPDMEKQVLRRKLKWAGHVSRMKYDRWAKIVSEWDPRGSARPRGRPPKRWADDIKDSIKIFIHNEALRGNLGHGRRRIGILEARRAWSTVGRDRVTWRSLVHAGHRFRADVVHVPTYCEVCNQLIWHHEKLFICVACRITCHKKCHPKVSHPCHLTGKPINPNAGNGGRFFGASLSSIVDDEHTVPQLLDRLFFAIEARALFVEGVYRKSGSVAQVRSVRKIIESTPDADAVNLEEAGIHVLTTLVKAFFRELSEPIIIFDLYENFLNVSGMVVL